jgi:hypothetical protein
LWIASGLLVLLAGSFAALRWSHRGAYVLVLLATIEMFAFARPLRPTFNPESVQFPQVKELVTGQKGDFRILNTLGYNSAMSTGAMDVCGHDPGISRRYAEFFTFTQGGDPNGASQDMKFSHINRLFLMLRLKYLIEKKDNRVDVIEIRDPAVPRLELVNRFRVLEGRDAIFHELPDLDFRESVILESLPDPLPQVGTEQGTAKIIDESTDRLTIEAQLPAPAILVITDAYHPNWHIRALPGSSQKNYGIMPANYVLRAVPLSAGFHRFTMEYRPRLFVAGKWISIASLVVYLILCGFLTVRKVGTVAKTTGS